MADREIPDRVVAFWSSMAPDPSDRGEAELRRALVPAERGELERRASELRNALAPAPQALDGKAIAAISAMLGGFPQQQRHDPATAKVIAGAYHYVVRDQPHWAILEACERIRAREAGLNPSFPPTEPEFAGVVKLRSMIYRQRLRHTEAVLRAKVQPAPAPKLSKEEIEARLGRSVGGTKPDAMPPPVLPVTDGKHAERVAADLAARRKREEAA